LVKVDLSAHVTRHREPEARTGEFAVKAARCGYAGERSLFVRLAKPLHPIARLVGRLRRSAAKRIRRVTAESVTLGSDFGLNWSDWERFAARRLSAAGLRSPERRWLRPSAEQGSGRRLWLVFVTNGGDSPASLAASLAAARRLEADAAFGVACITAGQEL
jgi:hypothetical protein